MPFRFTRGFASMKVNERMPMANIMAKVFFFVKQCIFPKKAVNLKMRLYMGLLFLILLKYSFQIPNNKTKFFSKN